MFDATTERGKRAPSPAAATASAAGALLLARRARLAPLSATMESLKGVALLRSRSTLQESDAARTTASIGVRKDRSGGYGFPRDV